MDVFNIKDNYLPSNLDLLLKLSCSFDLNTAFIMKKLDLSGYSKNTNKEKLHLVAQHYTMCGFVNHGECINVKRKENQKFIVS